MKSTPHFGVIGAGPAGLAISLFLKETSEILEKESFPGGHSSSFSPGGFTFDYGPHIMFSKNKPILDFMVRSLGENVHRCKRHNKISFKDRLVKYPFENDLKSLPLEDNFACLKEFLINPYQEKYSQPENMKEWMLKTFGSGICERYLFPYNEKVWNIPVQELSMSWASRIPNPPVDDVIRSSIGFETEGYTHQLFYHYPKRGGYQAISEAWAKSSQIIYQFDVQTIEKTSNHHFRVSNGSETREYPALISTMPIQHLIKRLKLAIPKEVTEAVNQLIVNPMFIISFGIKGTDPDQFTAIYFPEKDFWVNRISYPCTFSPENGPKGHHSIQAEITCTPDSAIWQKTDEEILNHVREGLLARKLIKDRASIILEDVKRKEMSYVVYDLHYEKNVKIIRDWFTSQNIHLVGRFSYFEYVNVDMVVEQALKMAAFLNDQKQPTFQIDLLNQGLTRLGISGSINPSGPTY